LIIADDRRTIREHIIKAKEKLFTSIYGKGSTMPFWRRKKAVPPEYARHGVTQHVGPQTTIIDDRRYYEDAPYPLPKDAQEINRLDLQHYCLRCAMHGNYKAQLDPEHIHRILDVGCGTGRWCIEMAQTFPQAQVVGVDLERAENVGVEMPSNYQFTVANVLQGLPFADHTFDYTHQRLLMMAIPRQQWIPEMRELLRVTRPGGSIELMELGTTFLPQGEYTARWCDWGMKISTPRGLDPSAVSHLATFARQAGFQHVVEQTFDLPVTNWGGVLTGWEARIGNMLGADLKEVYQSSLPLVKKELGLDDALLHAMPELLEAEWKRLHVRLRFFVVLGRKPAEPWKQEQPTAKPHRSTVHLGSF
jgi:ubiquinone/menaquinone biosynthesis C-methylase UbiE